MLPTAVVRHRRASWVRMMMPLLLAAQARERDATVATVDAADDDAQQDAARKWRSWLETGLVGCARRAA
jgi:hypothetical protein